MQNLLFYPVKCILLCTWGKSAENLHLDSPAASEIYFYLFVYYYCYYF